MARLLPKALRGHVFVTPGSLLRWHADLVKPRWTYTHRGPGRPLARPIARELVLGMAAENPTLGLARPPAYPPKAGTAASAMPSAEDCR
ncbi:hypothetical protein [Streptomyces sp. NPDC059349]|uniref:hypothetical protein n=1 Tax=Streptomyces sp. NPDC059349 TaxID=3346808 RepID=UPI0036CEC950